MEEVHKVMAYGRTSEILTYGDGYVLKLFRPGIPLELIEGEFRISASVHKHGISTPQPIKIISMNERKGIIYQEVSGITMLKGLSKKPWTIKKEATRMAKIHLNIHSRNVDDMPRQKDVLKERIYQAPILTMEEKEQIISCMNELREDSKLCHGDFHPDNIILGNTEWIIDWMTGMTGNPAGDIARTVILFKVGTMPENTPRILVYIFSYLRRQILKYYINTYLKNSSISFDEIERWIVPVAAARLSEWIPDDEKQEIVNLIRRTL